MALSMQISATMEAGVYLMTLISLMKMLVMGLLFNRLQSASRATIISWYLLTENKKPIVSITAPTGGSIYVAPATVAIKASASDADGTISSVKFYNGSTYLKTVFTAPYNYTISGLAGGTYYITAKA